MDPMIGTHIDRFVIESVIGEGGMARVFKARDTRLNRAVALKLIRKELFGEVVLQEIRRRFEREALSLASLTHPNIVSVFDYGEYNGAPYLVLAYLPGGTLRERTGSPVPSAEAASLLAPIARALGYAHQQGIVHRDIKPSNIMFSASGDPLLTDFGIVKLVEGGDGGAAALTTTGVTIGTPEYMAPEQGLGKPVDERADVYALGVVFYELLTGRRPYHADTPMQVLLKHVSEPLPDPLKLAPEIPAEALAVLNKALAKDPEDRYRHMADFVAALHVLAGSPESKPTLRAAVLAHTPPPVPLTPPPQAPPPQAPPPAGPPPAGPPPAGPPPAGPPASHPAFTAPIPAAAKTPFTQSPSTPPPTSQPPVPNAEGKSQATVIPPPGDSGETMAAPFAARGSLLGTAPISIPPPAQPGAAQTTTMPPVPAPPPPAAQAEQVRKPPTQAAVRSMPPPAAQLPAAQKKLPIWALIAVFAALFLVVGGALAYNQFFGPGSQAAVPTFTLFVFTQPVTEESGVGLADTPGGSALESTPSPEPLTETPTLESSPEYSPTPTNETTATSEIVPPTATAAILNPTKPPVVVAPTKTQPVIATTPVPPTAVPTDTPMTPTDTPVTPTDTPVTPSDTPVTPTLTYTQKPSVSLKATLICGLLVCRSPILTGTTVSFRGLVTNQTFLSFKILVEQAMTDPCTRKTTVFNNATVTLPGGIGETYAISYDVTIPKDTLCLGIFTYTLRVTNLATSKVYSTAVNYELSK